VLKTIADREKETRAAGVDRKRKFRRPVVPGDQLRLEMSVVKRRLP